MAANKPNIHQRLHAVMGEVKYVQKEKKQGMNYSIVSHDDVTAKVRPSLHNHGIVYFPCSLEYEQVGNRTQVRLAVRFVNIDSPEDFIEVPSLGYGIDSQDKGPGKAVSYAVKYALLKALGLETGDDPDQDQNVAYDGQDPAEKDSGDEKTEPKKEPKPATKKKTEDLKPPTWEAWRDKVGIEVAQLENEKARKTYVETIREPYEQCQKENPEVAEQVRSMLAQRKQELAESSN